jgi:hypothetical protein
MKSNNKEILGFRKFDTAMSKILSVSHAELQRRGAKWKKQRKRKKR